MSPGDSHPKRGNDRQPGRAHALAEIVGVVPGLDVFLFLSFVDIVVVVKIGGRQVHMFLTEML